VTAPTVAQAFEHLYFLERAAKTIILAYSTGQPLNVLTDEMAQRTAEDWRLYDGMALAHFEQLKARLDRTDPSYKD
jgi:ribulose-5-phosphate 4-epimerase/fuculose-1-phosphate aldolase